MYVHIYIYIYYARGLFFEAGSLFRRWQGVGMIRKSMYIYVYIYIYVYNIIKYIKIV